jgi:hypothetical protein
MKTHRQLNIRILRQGLVKAKKPEGFDEWTDLEKRQWADNILEALDDDAILEALADFGNPKEEGYFDCAPDAVAIETEEGDTLFTTLAWEAFKDPDIDENIQEMLPSDLTDIEKIKLLDQARIDALKSYRQKHGAKILGDIMADPDAPSLLKEIIEENNITYIGFEMASYSEDYMPDHCVYIYLSGDILIGVQTEDKSYTWEECGYEYGDIDIARPEDFGRAIERKADAKEGVAAINYLSKLFETLQASDRETFRDYILEKE